MGDAWDDASMTAGRRPALLANESILIVQKDVGLYDGSTRLQDYDSGQAYTTTHRLIWIHASEKVAKSIHLERIQTISNTGGFSMSGVLPSTSTFLKSSPKIILTLNPATRTPSTPSTLPTATSSPSRPPPTPWLCAICDHTNAPSRPKCAECGVPRTADAKTLPGSTPTPPPAAAGACPACTFVNHPDMVTCEMCETPLGPPKPSPGSAGTSPERKPSTSAGDAGVVVKLSFRGGGLNEFLKVVKGAVAEKAWEKQVETLPTPPPSTSVAVSGSSAGGGISRIMKSVDDEKKTTDTTLSTAFKDLESLMAKASQMVKLAETISTKMAATSGAAASGTDDLATFRTYLVDLGISSPVTSDGEIRDVAGNMFIQELARELAEFLTKLLNTRRTMIPLIDLYCMLNRARGVALISPSDLHAAANHLPTLHLPFHLRRFPRSGLLVIEARADGVDLDATVADAVVEVVRSNERFRVKGINAVELAEVAGVSVVLAVEQLGIAEGRGAVCRDDTIEGLRFYENRIAAFEVDEGKAMFKPGSRTAVGR
ncbi:Vacuolar protein-sorting-associated protein 36 [Phlyctochytrium bullatum]|nr:Vacuolar protein-sorting-associated protein 36 [Phlyctochytrium bullatum]